ncbi:MAG: tRNA threonylcarbamoyladenosine dehydratase [Candidatus Cloacimonetes bacterium HGW-Cloacimonetes-1]|jgi:tRNA A37 threonylcarbamoyladenosine dehydratase|nr:MAG: tRNA threonylcarbamoyladenosine dehydratase [Candidatus Cloacimonetes bacterium HGW-Cloacimonetes-1]
MFMDQFNRTTILIGEQGIKKLHAARVAVIGLGGVGSYAAEALVRAGVGSFLIIDFDVVNLTNLNRQLLATHPGIGQSKTELMKERMLAINPHCVVDIQNVFLAEENRAEILTNVDYIVDAIDSLGPKIGLLEYAIKSGIKVISVMGAGNRLDPSKIEIVEVSKTYNCPLAKRVRKFLRRRGIKGGFPCVYTSELPISPEEDEDTPDELIIHRGRERKVVGSISYMPAIMGMMAASWVIREIIAFE